MLLLDEGLDPSASMPDRHQARSERRSQGQREQERLEREDGPLPAQPLTSALGPCQERQGRIKPVRRRGPGRPRRFRRSTQAVSGAVVQSPQPNDRHRGHAEQAHDRCARSRFGAGQHLRAAAGTVAATEGRTLKSGPSPDQAPSDLSPRSRTAMPPSHTVRARNPPISPPQSTPHGGPSPSGGWAMSSKKIASNRRVAKTATGDTATTRNNRDTLDPRPGMTARTTNAESDVSNARPRMRWPQPVPPGPDDSGNRECERGLTPNPKLSRPSEGSAPYQGRAVLAATAPAPMATAARDGRTDNVTCFGSIGAVPVGPSKRSVGPPLTSRSFHSDPCRASHLP